VAAVAVAVAVADRDDALARADDMAETMVAACACAGSSPSCCGCCCWEARSHRLAEARASAAAGTAASHAIGDGPEVDIIVGMGGYVKNMVTHSHPAGGQVTKERHSNWLNCLLFVSKLRFIISKVLAKEDAHVSMEGRRQQCVSKWSRRRRLDVLELRKKERPHVCASV